MRRLVSPIVGDSVFVVSCQGMSFESTRTWAGIFSSISKDTDFCTKSVFMAVQALGTPGAGSHTHLILARFDTKVSGF